MPMKTFAVVDVWDAMCSDRPYRGALSADYARKIIRTDAGTHFDPRVVDAFFEILDKSGRNHLQ